MLYEVITRTGQDMTFQYMPYATPGEANGLGWFGFTADPIFLHVITSYSIHYTKLYEPAPPRFNTRGRRCYN